MNSKRSAKYTEAVVNMIMDLKILDLNEICPIIKIILENEDLNLENLVGFFVVIQYFRIIYNNKLKSF